MNASARVPADETRPLPFVVTRLLHGYVMRQIVGEPLDKPERRAAVSLDGPDDKVDDLVRRDVTPAIEGRRHVDVDAGALPSEKGDAGLEAAGRRRAAGDELLLQGLPVGEQEDVDGAEVLAERGLDRPDRLREVLCHDGHL